MPLILIVVPTLDSYLLLDRLCSSLIAQTWTNWRVVFVDGPSSSLHTDWLAQCCSSDSRFSWISQDISLHPGIFGAMNQGFAYAAEVSADWLLFWGSDDWAASPNILSQLISLIESRFVDQSDPHLLVCRGQYCDLTSGQLGRKASFAKSALLDVRMYRRSLFWGATPPHQATLFGVASRNYLSGYDLGFRLSADLDYFLKISLCSDLVVSSVDLELVYMSDGGVSGQQTQRRLQEVRRAYRRAFGWKWWIPFLARYVRRLFGLFTTFG